jgi:hypothetical protein
MLVYATMNNKGGHLPDAFVSRHFTKTGERSAKTRRWHMRCNDLSKEKDAGGEIWDESSLLRSLGVGN